MIRSRFFLVTVTAGVMVILLFVTFSQNTGAPAAEEISLVPNQQARQPQQTEQIVFKPKQDAPILSETEREAQLKKIIPQKDDLIFNGLSSAKITADMAPADAEKSFYQYIEHNDITCKKSFRFGGAPDGGWDWCLVEPYQPVKDKCIVYSFGIGTVWTFDDAIANPKEYGCLDRAFDPTNNKKDHIRGDRIHFYSRGIGGSNRVDKLIAYNIKHPEMTLRTFAAFREEFGETDTVIDYLKMDVEYSEWDSFRTILYNGDLNNVKQIGLEIHTNEVFANKESSVPLLKLYFDVLKGIENAGFLQWSTHANMQATYMSKKTKLKRTCCYEIKWINIKVLTGEFNQPRPLVPMSEGYTWTGLTDQQNEKQFDRFIHDVHHRCSAVTQIPAGLPAEKLRICTENIKSKPCTVLSVGQGGKHINADEVKSKLECDVTLINIESQDKVAQAIKDIEKKQDISLLYVNLDMIIWDFIKALLDSSSIKNIKQLILVARTKEFVTNSVSTKDDFIGYYDQLYKLQAAGFKKFYVINSQEGMYDSKRTGDRMTHSFTLHYVR